MKDNDIEGLFEILQDSYPLSDQVLIAVLTSKLTADQKEDILEQNIDFGESVDSVFAAINWPTNLKQEITQKRQKSVPFQPILDEFEKLFPGYVSLRKVLDNAELQFLLGGGDPASSDNPSSKNFLGRVLSTLVNSKTELQVGSAINLYLPFRQISIRNGNLDILNYIRANNNVPINVPANEPANGLPISNAPLPVDTNNIIVTPNEQINGCGGGVISAGTDNSGRLSFHSNFKGTGLSYYWNFGDGYVSYKEEPVHAYNDSLPHKVTVTVFDDLGINCGGAGGTTASSGGGNNNPSGTNCMLTGNVIVQGGSNLTISTNVSIIGAFNSPLSFSWNFGDGGVSPFQSTTHIYQFPRTFVLTVNVTDATGCMFVFTQNVTVTSPNPIVTPTCCNRYDYQREGALNPDDHHRFVHTLKTINFWGIHGDVYADISTYSKSSFINIWFWSHNTSGVDFNGSVFRFDSNTNNNCGLSTTVSKIQTGIYTWNTIRQPVPKPIYTEFQCVSSDASAFGVSNHLTLSNCQ